MTYQVHHNDVTFKSESLKYKYVQMYGNPTQILAQCTMHTGRKLKN